MSRSLASKLFLAASIVALGVATTASAAPQSQHRAHKTKSPILDNFSFQCNDSNADGLAMMKQGIITACIPLQNTAGGIYGLKYLKYGYPAKVTLTLPAGASFIGGKIRITGWNREHPKKAKPTKFDRSWHWVKTRTTAGGTTVTVMKPRLFVRHLLFAASAHFTIQLPNNPSVAVVKMKAIFPGVKGAPKQTACQTFYDSSTGTPPPANQCIS